MAEQLCYVTASAIETNLEHSLILFTSCFQNFCTAHLTASIPSIVDDALMIWPLMQGYPIATWGAPQENRPQDLCHCHTKRTMLPILLLVWHRLCPTNPSFGMTQTTEYNLWRCKVAEYNFIVGVIPKEGLAGPCPPILLLAWQPQRS